MTPNYITQATKTFKQETFNQSNRHKCHRDFSEHAKGKPLMLFIVHPNQKRSRNKKHIAELEDFFIQASVAKNLGLQSIHSARRPASTTQRVVRSGVGKRSSPETTFRTLFDNHK